MGKVTGELLVTFERTCHPVVTAGAIFQGVKIQVRDKKAAVAGADKAFKRFLVRRRKKSGRWGAGLRKRILLVGVGRLLRGRLTWQEGESAWLVKGSPRHSARWGTVAGGMVAPKRYVPVLMPRSCDYGLMRTKGLCRCNDIQDSEMRSSWIPLGGWRGR